MNESQQSGDLDSNIRLDVGGWISGPSLSPDQLPPPRSLDVPPASTAWRELSGAIAQTLSLPRPATTRDEVTYLRIYRDRARLVLLACRRILADREIEDDPRDLMAVVVSLREQAAQLGDDAYENAPDPS
jgi:hypothetical protein